MGQQPERHPPQAAPPAFAPRALGLDAAFELIEQELHAQRELIVPVHTES